MMSRSHSFSKYQGLGNDFILFDNRHDSAVLFDASQVKQLCDRRFGIGADGVIFLLAGKENCDYSMRIFNSNGSEPQMCGNGIRCLAKYIVEDIRGLDVAALSEDLHLTIWTKAGVMRPTVRKDNSITVDMGEPVLTAELIPTTLSPAVQDTPVVESVLRVGGKHDFLVTPVSMGNPHCVSHFAFLQFSTA